MLDQIGNQLTYPDAVRLYGKAQADAMFMQHATNPQPTSYLDVMQQRGQDAAMSGLSGLMNAVQTSKDYLQKTPVTSMMHDVSNLGRAGLNAAKNYEDGDLGRYIRGVGQEYVDQGTSGYSALEGGVADHLLGTMTGDQGRINRGNERLADATTQLGSIALDASDLAFPALGAGIGAIKAGKRVGGLLDNIASSADLPDLRATPLKDAIEIARQEPHLIPSGEKAEGAYVGGPRNIKNRDDLEKMRANLDEQIERGVEGGDWYKRYNEDIRHVTGNDKLQNLWMSKQEGTFSAQAAPETELNFALRDNNSAVATGSPLKSKTGSQHRASMAAIANKDPSLYELGPKTGEYAQRVNPDGAGFEKATGVNDFRHLRNLGYTELSGEAQMGAVGKPGHAFADYETALAVDRANAKNLGGRSDWTGEQIQAAPWVTQKGDDFFTRYKKRYMGNAADSMGLDWNEDIPRPNSDPMVEAQARKDAFDYANSTIGDSYDKQTAFGTYEAQPYAGANQLERLAGASEAARSTFMNDPRSTWANAPGGRDAIYAGMGVEGTGANMRVRPSTTMRGEYTPPGGELEANAGEVARPLVGFEYAPIEGKFKKDGTPAVTTTKSMPQSDQDLMNIGEATRAYIDTQGAGAWHKNWLNGKTADSKNIFIKSDKIAPATKEQMSAAKEVASRYGYTSAIDTGEGLTITSFYPDEPPTLNKKQREALSEELSAIQGYNDVYAVNTDSGYLGYEGDWEKGVGSGAATKKLLEFFDSAPKATVDAMDRNPYLAQNALARISRDTEYSAKYGASREDIQNARKIIGEGPGWVGRLKAAVKKGAILPAVGLGIMTASQLGQMDQQDQPRT